MHNDSKSQTQLWFQGGRGYVHVQLQSLSLIEELPSLDANTDGKLDAGECEAGQASILSYLAGGMALGPGIDARAQLTGKRILIEERPQDGFGFDSYQWLEVRWDFAAESPADLQLGLSWFETSSPGHLDQLWLQWEAREWTHLQRVSGAEALEVSPLRHQNTLAARQVAQGMWLDGAGLALVLVWAVVYSSRSQRAPESMHRQALAAFLVMALVGGCAATFLELPSLLVGVSLPIALTYGFLDDAYSPATKWYFPSSLWGLLTGAAWWSLWAKQARNVWANLPLPRDEDSPLAKAWGIGWPTTEAMGAAHFWTLGGLALLGVGCAMLLATACVSKFGPKVRFALVAAACVWLAVPWLGTLLR